MRSQNKKDGSVFGLLLKNQILFTICLIAAFLTLGVVFALRGYQSITVAQPEQISANLRFLESGKYSQFPAEKILGEGGYIAVLAQDGSELYNGGKLPAALSPEELRYVPDYSFLDTVTVTALKTSEGASNYRIDIAASKAETYVLDNAYHLLYASGKFITEDISAQEFRLLSQTHFSGYHVGKYAFKTAEGNNATLLLFSKQGAATAFLGQQVKALPRLGIAALALYCGMIAIFVLWLQKKITAPLQSLCSGIDGYELGQTPQVFCKGPKEFQQIANSFSALTDRLDESEHARRNLEAGRRKMIASIAHDLKTPVTVVLGYADALCDGIVPPQEQQMYLDTIRQKASGLNSLIQAFYEYSKLEHPDYHPTLERTDICISARDYAAEKYTELETAGFLPEVDIPETHLFCMIDRPLLRRAFENIVSNSIKHNSAGTTIFFSLAPSGSEVSILLGDNGIGIPDETAAVIFDPFVMGETSRGHGGSGLGLSIAQQIVQAHHGQIRLVRDGGPCRTAFEIELPIIP